MGGSRSGVGAAAIGAVAGLVWLSRIGAAGAIGALPIGGIGALLLGAALSVLLRPADRRGTEIAALAGLVGALLAVPLALAVGALQALLLGGSAVLAAIAAGRAAVALEPAPVDVPAPVVSWPLAAKIAADEMLLGLELSQRGGFARDEEVARVVDELARARECFARQGFLDAPETYHVRPPPLLAPEIRVRRIAGHAVEVLRFESGYAPREGEPGRARWLVYTGCREGWAYVVRRGGAGRPWLVCTNGYRMGHAAIDVRVFERFFGRLGLNVVIPVLPLHGPRRRAVHSGTGFLGLDVLDTLHAEAQAVWDIRRLIGWIRAQEPSAIGALGLSLGGYTTAVYASLEEGLVCAIPGIPLADIPRMLARHAIPRQLERAIRGGYSLDAAREVLRVVSPLVLAPRVPRAGRMFFGAVADRLVTPDQVRDLWRHWDEPEIVWYQGGHVTFRLERSVFAGIDRTLRRAGLIGDERAGEPADERVAGRIAARGGAEEQRA